LRFRSAARIAACKSIACLRVASGAFPAISASAISRAVIGVPARRITSTALRNSVPRLNHGFAFVAALRCDGGNAEARLEHLKHGFNLHHGGADFDGCPLVVHQLPGQFGVKLRQRENGLLG
jgi:hypothetical protein